MEREGNFAAGFTGESFRSIPGGVFPLYHVLAAMGEFAGGEVIPSKSSNPLGVNLLTLRKEGRIRLLCANHTHKKQDIWIEASDGPPWQGGERPPQVRFLDETNVEAAMRNPEAFRAQTGRPLQAESGRLHLDLLPYGIAQVDFLEAEPEFG
jgi:hypothetical protein